MTNFKSKERNIDSEHLSLFFSNNPINAENISLQWIGVDFSSHGHYKISSTWYVDDNEVEVIRLTSNMQLIDAWKSGINDLWEDGDDGYDNWEEVAEAMLYAIDLEIE